MGCSHAVVALCCSFQVAGSFLVTTTFAGRSGIGMALGRHAVHDCKTSDEVAVTAAPSASRQVFFMAVNC